MYIIVLCRCMMCGGCWVDDVMAMLSCPTDCNLPSLYSIFPQMVKKYKADHGYFPPFADPVLGNVS